MTELTFAEQLEVMRISVQAQRVMDARAVLAAAEGERPLFKALTRLSYALMGRPNPEDLELRSAEDLYVETYTRCGVDSADGIAALELLNEVRQSRGLRPI